MVNRIRLRVLLCLSHCPEIVRRTTIACIAYLLALPLAFAQATSKTLDIDPVYQKTSVWCWLAVGEMIFTHYKIPNVNPADIYQCGIIGLLTLKSSMKIPAACNEQCLVCTIPAGSNARFVSELEDYPRLAATASNTPVPRLVADMRPNAASFAKIRTEIDAGRPVIAGISPSGGAPAGLSEHVALIVGYDLESDGTQTLIVNDPYPFIANHYIAAGGTQVHGNPGQYRIEHDSYESDLHWKQTYLITTKGQHQPQSNPTGRRCCYKATATSISMPYALPLGSPCFWGRNQGLVCE